MNNICYLWFVICDLPTELVIGIDIRVLANKYKSGVDEYARNLLSHLLPLDPSIKYKLFFAGFTKPSFDYDFLKLPNVTFYFYKTSNRLLMNPSHMLLNRPKLDAVLGGVDAFYSPHIFMPVSLSSGVRYVATVHDCAFVHHPEFFPVDKLLWHRIETRPKRQMRRADALIADSHSTKSDVAAHYGIDEKAVTVVYPGLTQPRTNIRVKPAFKKQFKKPFVLYLGTLEPRKNVAGLLEAYDELRARSRTRVQLVIAGAAGWMYRGLFSRMTRSLYRKDIRSIGPVSNEEKEWLLSNASVFVYPSFFEGFGFPPLEALSYGTPVVTSLTSSIPEAAGDAALLINPRHSAEIAKAMDILLTDKKQRDVLRERGRKIVKQFSWRRTAEETLRLLRSGS